MTYTPDEVAQRQAGRACKVCAVDISHRFHTARYCEACWARKRRRGADPCIDCGADISHKRSDAKRCDDCIRLDGNARCRKYWDSYRLQPDLKQRKSDYWNDHYRNNPDYKVRHDAAKYKRRKTLDGTYTPKELAEKFGSFGNRCAYCNADEPLTVDHVIPVSKGGSNTIDNIVPACRSCNASKGNTDLHEWLSRRVTA